MGWRLAPLHNSLLVPNKPIFVGEISVTLFVLGQQCIYIFLEDKTPDLNLEKEIPSKEKGRASKYPEATDDLPRPINWDGR